MKRLFPKKRNKTTDSGHSSAIQLALEIDILARTIWGEARGEGSIGMQAVAATILNRVRIAEEKGSYWWGRSIVDICQKPQQFSAWNKDDPNCQKLRSIDESQSLLGLEHDRLEFGRPQGLSCRRGPTWTARLATSHDHVTAPHHAPRDVGEWGEVSTGPDASLLRNHGVNARVQHGDESRRHEGSDPARRPKQDVGP